MNAMNVSVKKSSAVNALAIGLLILVSCGVSVGQNIRVSNTSASIGKGRYRWTIFIDGSPADLNQIDFVEYYLYPIFDNPNRKIYQPRSGPRAFSTSDIAFRPAPVQVVINFRGQRGKISFDYTLRLRSDFSKSWYVILASFNLSEGGKAEDLATRYQAQGFKAYRVDTTSGDFPNFDRALWAVVLGPGTLAEMRNQLRRVPKLSDATPYVRQSAKY